MRMSRSVVVSLVVGLMPLAIAVAQDSSPSAKPADQVDSMGNGPVMDNHMMSLNSQVNEIVSELEQNVSDLQGAKDKNAIESKLIQQEALIERLKSSLDGRCGMSTEMMGESAGHMTKGSMMMGGGMTGSGTQRSATGSSSSQNR